MSVSMNASASLKRSRDLEVANDQEPKKKKSIFNRFKVFRIDDSNKSLNLWALPPPSRCFFPFNNFESFKKPTPRISPSASSSSIITCIGSQPQSTPIPTKQAHFPIIGSFRYQS